MNLAFDTILNISYTLETMCYFHLLPQSLGKVGKVILIDKDGDVRVQFNGPVWTFSPAALKKVPASTEVSGDSGGKILFEIDLSKY